MREQFRNNSVARQALLNKAKMIFVCFNRKEQLLCFPQHQIQYAKKMVMLGRVLTDCWFVFSEPPLFYFAVDFLSYNLLVLSNINNLLTYSGLFT